MKSFSAFTLSFALFLLATDARATESGASGNWIFNMSGPNGETVKLPMELTVKGKKLEGRMDRGGNRWLKLKNGKVDGSNISFTVERDRPGGGSMVYAVTGKLSDDKLAGEAKTTFQGQEVTGDWSANRQKATVSKIAGTWTLHLQDPNGGEVDLPMELKVENQKLSGRVSRGDDRWMSVENGKVDGDKFTFTTKRDRPSGGEMIYKMNGKLVDGQLKGKATTSMEGAGEVTADWRATKAER